MYVPKLESSFNKDSLSNLYTVTSESMHLWKMTTSSLMDGVAKNRLPFPSLFPPVPSNDFLCSNEDFRH